MPATKLSPKAARRIVRQYLRTAILVTSDVGNNSSNTKLFDAFLSLRDDRLPALDAKLDAALATLARREAR
jgi:hypothetical protein